jgi:very-short-patch-repair endonuclease
MCDREISVKGLSQHLKIHNISFEDYLHEYPEQFPNWHPCLICGKLTPQKTTCSRKCEGEHKRQLYTGRKGHTFTEEEKRKISRTRKKQGSPWLNGKILTNEHKQNIAKTRKKRGCGIGEKNPMYGKTHSPEAIKKIFSHKKMNKTEKLVADLLDKNNIKYHFQFFINQDGICKSYDFKIKDKPIIIEVDGDFWHGGPGSETHWKDYKKVQRNDILKEQIANKNGYKIFRFWESEIKKNANIILQYLY